MNHESKENSQRLTGLQARAVLLFILPNFIVPPALALFAFAVGSLVGLALGWAAAVVAAGVALYRYLTVSVEVTHNQVRVRNVWRTVVLDGEIEGVTLKPAYGFPNNPPVFVLSASGRRVPCLVSCCLAPKNRKKVAIWFDSEFPIYESTLKRYVEWK